MKKEQEQEVDEKEEKRKTNSKRQSSKDNLRSCQRKGKRKLSGRQLQALISSWFLTNLMSLFPTVFPLTESSQNCTTNIDEKFTPQFLANLVY